MLRAGEWEQVTPGVGRLALPATSASAAARSRRRRAAARSRSSCSAAAAASRPRASAGSSAAARRVFDGMPWALYLPRDTDYRVEARGASSRSAARAASARREPVLVRPEEVEVEVRGAGNATRQINHIVKPGFPAERLLVVEVFTPAGNWSSYPPHKHDEDRPPGEVVLEEIYYYRTAQPEAFALQRLYSPRHGVDVTRRPCATATCMLVPYGYHTTAAAHGYDLYYLNALAGDRRSMAAADDPALAWIRASWRDLEPDPRVPARHARRPALIRLANAPVSYGAFELTVGVLPNVAGPEEVLAAVADAGYEGIELGPPGYLGDEEVLRARLERFGLSLAGGFIQVRFSQPEDWDEDLAAMTDTLDLLAAGDGRDARPVLSDFGSPVRIANPGRAASDHSPRPGRAGMAAARRRGRTCRRVGACTRLRADLPPPCGHVRRSAVGDRATPRADRRRATARHRSPRPRRRRPAPGAPGLA